MFALANDVLEAQVDFSPFDIYVSTMGNLDKDDFRIKHVPSGLEYLVRFQAKGAAVVVELSVTFEVTRLEADCAPEVIGTFDTTFDTLRYILIDAIVDAHFRKFRKD